MKSTEFTRLPREIQEDLLYNSGVFVGKRKMGGYSAILFQLEGFYVEVFYSRYRRDVAFMEVSTEPDVLDRYLEPFDMGELMKQ